MQEKSISLFDDSRLIQYLSNIDNTRNYWMVRTMGGLYYGDFIRNNYIAIGFDEISISDIDNLPLDFNSAKHGLKSLISDNYEDVSQHGYYASQILHFAREIKVNDIVVIPSTGASHVAIGIVQSEMYEESNPIIDSEHVCAFKKRRRIDWKVYCRRANLPPMVQLIFNSRHPVTKISNYAPYLDSLLNNCYYKGDKLHLVLNIKTRTDVSMSDFFCLEQIRVLAEDFCKEVGMPMHDPIIVKIQMESPGKARFESKHIFGMLAFGFIIIALCGGGISYSHVDGFDMYTNGLPGAISDFLDRKADREFLKSLSNSLDSLKVEKPQDIEPLIELVDVKNDVRKKY